MSNQIDDDEIAQFVTKAADFETPSGVSVTIEFEDGSVMSREWGAVEAAPETTTEAPERNEAEIRDAWAKIAADDWQEFQAAAAEYDVVNMKREPMVDTLTDMGVMPGDDSPDDSPEQSEPETFTDLSGSEQDDLRAAVETDPSEADFKQAKSLLETGADYVSLAGECLNHEAHEGEDVGAKLTPDGLIPFCNGCEHKADDVTVDRLSDTEKTVFRALRKDGVMSSKALAMAED